MIRFLSKAFSKGKHAPRRHGRKRINLALQGGGAHGAFTWGVLDHLLEDGRLTIDGISGASAGAVNAVILADGLARGGRDAARQRLAEFWRAASFDGTLPAAQRAVIDRLMSFVPAAGSPVQAWVDAWSRFLSPYDLNPLNINPLKDLIDRFVDFDAIRQCEELRLFVSATNVHTGQLRVFSRREITADAVMASAALPHVFRAVEIDGVPYWDGAEHGLRSIAFPAISTGVYRFPADLAARIAVGTVASELAGAPRGIERAVFCCFSDESADHHAHAFYECGLA